MKLLANVVIYPSAVIQAPESCFGESRALARRFSQVLKLEVTNRKDAKPNNHLSSRNAVSDFSWLSADMKAVHMTD